jgi:hypothetical protein
MDTMLREAEHPCGITPEFFGLFRAFRTKIHTTDLAYNDAMEPVMNALQGHLDRRCKPALRREHIPPILARLKDVARFGQRLDPTLTSSKRGSELLDVRLTTDMCRKITRDEDDLELGLSLLVIRIFPVSRKVYTSQGGHYDEWYETHSRSTNFAHFSAHALARWFQRSFLTSEESLIDALWLAYWQYHTLMSTLSNDGPFRLIVPGAGEWRGRVTNMEDATTDQHAEVRISRSLDIRTFV